MASILTSELELPYAVWERSSGQPGHGTLERPTDAAADESPEDAELAARFAAAVAELRAPEVWQVSAMPPFVDVSLDVPEVDLPGSARRIIGLYPTLRDWYLRSRPLLERV